MTDADQAAAQQVAEELANGRQPLWTQFRLGWRRTYYNMAQALGLKRLQDLLQGATSSLSASHPLWILGQEYNLLGKGNATVGDSQLDEEVVGQVLEDFGSRVWMTYRRDFPPVGGSDLTSDVGWGCTLRSGQMLLAEALMRHSIGRSWRRSLAGGYPDALLGLLRSFWDVPDPSSPFSVHNLCVDGAAYGITPGEWLGPWVLCRALETAVNKARPGGLHAHMVAQPGGGAPVLYPSSVLTQYWGDERDAAAAPAQQHGSPEGGDGEPPGSSVCKGLVVLLPLTLGIGKVNSVYIAQLRAVLTWRQSIGIVGGRPSSSLYFIGFQHEHVLYLDPHEVQPAVHEFGDVASYHCDSLRLMQLANIDPSLAIGFYCRSPDDFRSLCGKLSALEKTATGAPLVSVASGVAPTAREWQEHHAAGEAALSQPASPEGKPGGDDWEML